MLKITTVLTCALLLCTGAWATVYQWTDSQGIIHMTDDPDKVPARYRNVMKTRTIDTGENIMPSGGPASTAPSPVPEGREDVSYGGHGMKWWRGSFKEAREDLENLNNQIVDKKKELEHLRRQRALYQKPSDRVAYYALMDEIGKDEEQVKVLQKRLDDLESRADAARVPQGWR